MVLPKHTRHTSFLIKMDLSNAAELEMSCSCTAPGHRPKIQLQNGFQTGTCVTDG
jgi:hypothetical protein